MSVLLASQLDVKRIALEIGAPSSTVSGALTRLYRRFEIDSKKYVSHVRLMFLFLRGGIEL